MAPKSSSFYPPAPDVRAFAERSSHISCLAFTSKSRVCLSFCATPLTWRVSQHPGTVPVLCSSQLLLGTKTPHSRSLWRAEIGAGHGLLPASCPQNPLWPKLCPSAMHPSARSATSSVSHLGFRDAKACQDRDSGLFLINSTFYPSQPDSSGTGPGPAPGFSYAVPCPSAVFH